MGFTTGGKAYGLNSDVGFSGKSHEYSPRHHAAAKQELMNIRRALLEGTDELKSQTAQNYYMKARTIPGNNSEEMEFKVQYLLYAIKELVKSGKEKGLPNELRKLIAKYAGHQLPKTQYQLKEGQILKKDAKKIEKLLEPLIGIRQQEGFDFRNWWTKLSFAR